MPEGGHVYTYVFMEMMIQIAAHYKGCPDVRTMHVRDIWTMYEWLRPHLEELTKDAT